MRLLALAAAVLALGQAAPCSAWGFAAAAAPRPADLLRILSAHGAEPPSAAFSATAAALCASRGVTCVHPVGPPNVDEFNAVANGKYDAVLAEGAAAVDLADFAARSGVPVLRVAPSADAVEPQFERPAALILDALPDLASFGPGRALDPHRLAAMIPAAEIAAHIPTLRAALADPEFRRPAFTCTVPSESSVWRAWPPVPDAADAPLGLVMIVKDEAQSIAATIESAKHHIDAWTMVDTGSTDGTQAAIVAAFGDAVPGQLLSRPFVDFAATRNEALLAHGARTHVAFMPDADFRFTNLWRLRASAERMERACRDASPAPACGKAWLISRQDGGLIFRMQVAWPTAGQGSVDGWHYEYPVHEVSGRGREHGGEAVEFPHHSTAMVWIDGVVHNKSEVRWREFDLRILQAECEAKPHNTRVHFYLARTYMQVGDWEAAYEAFQKRIDMGGWYEEVFQSMLDQGRALIRLGRDPTPRLRAAFEYCPWRAEPLYELTMWHEDQVKKCEGGTPFLEGCQMAHRAAGYWAAKTAAALPRPEKDRLFVWGHVYDHQAALQKAVHAYYLSELGIGVLEDGATANAALAARFPGQAPYAGNVPLFDGLVRRFYGAARIPADVLAEKVAASAGSGAAPPPRSSGGVEGEASVEAASAAAAVA